jgi:hypothetical protein
MQGKPKIRDEELVCLVKKDLAASPFKGEGDRKVHPRLKRQDVGIGRNRVLNIMRPTNCSPRIEGSKYLKILIWCSDGTRILTVEDGWVWVFSIEEHCTLCKVGDQLAALEPVTQKESTLPICISMEHQNF